MRSVIAGATSRICTRTRLLGVSGTDVYASYPDLSEVAAMWQRHSLPMTRPLGLDGMARSRESIQDPNDGWPTRFSASILIVIRRKYMRSGVASTRASAVSVIRLALASASVFLMVSLDLSPASLSTVTRWFAIGGPGI